MSDASATPADRVDLFITTPENVLYQGPAHWVQVPLHDGLIGIWPGHSPLVGALSRGTIQYHTDEGTQTIPVRAGILRVDEERCFVLVGALADEQESSWSPQSDTLADELERALYEALPEEEIEALQEEE
ncbi:MAG TPA: hypothetical protein GX702_10535 [Chloroflexi bacterium]|jgi:F-type H+-transporting ATPase subunit epsilon|nr:hypothetical protein [Chloroflexota bacterium]